MPTMTRRRWFLVATALLLALLATGAAIAIPRLSWKRNHVAGALHVIKRNAGWCWFQDPRAIIDGDRIVVASIAGTDGHGSAWGDLDVTSYSIPDERATVGLLVQRFQRDDHNTPSLAVLPDGRYVAIYSQHSSDRLMRWKVSKKPGQVDAWGKERTLDVGGYATYSNTFTLSSKPDRIYSFHRGFERNPNLMIAEGGTADFTLAGRLFAFDLTEATGAVESKKTGVSQQPKSYVQYASNGVDAIHFIATECHPRCYENSVYHGVVRGDAVYDSFGKEIDHDVLDREASPLPSFTRIFEGDPDNVAWTVDLDIDAGGRPYAILSVQKDDAKTRHLKPPDGGFDNRYLYARFDGQAWKVTELAYAGTRLYPRERHYTALAALDPKDPNVVYVSTNADPATGAPLVSRADRKRHFEIFRGRSRDGGASWSWEAITADSTMDNLRPIIPRHPTVTALLWLRGTYKTMGSFDQNVVALIDP